MRLFILTSFILFANFVFAQSSIENNCNNFIDIKVAMEKIQPDSISKEEPKVWGTYIKSFFGFQLITKNSNYTIQEFTISGSYDNGDIVEVVNKGTHFGASAIRLVNSIKEKEFYISCIKAIDKLNRIHILKPFTYIFR